MLRLVVKLLLFGLALTGGTLFLAQWKLKDSIERLAIVMRPFAEFDYESARVNFNGEIQINSISAFVNEKDIQVEIGELRFFSGNLFQLFFLESQLNKSLLPDKAYISLKNVLIPFSRDLKKELSGNTVPSSSDILRSAYCGENTRFGINEWDAMGYSYFSFSTESVFTWDKRNNKGVASGRLSLEDAFDVNYQGSLSGVSEKLNTYDSDTAESWESELGLIEVQVKDQGYNRRIAEFCALNENIKPEEYYEKHVAAVANLLTQVEMKFANTGEDHYLNLIKPESEFLGTIQPKPNFQFGDIPYYDSQQLIEITGLKVLVNELPIERFIDNWSFDKFQKITELVKVKEQEIANKSSYKTVLISQAFQRVGLENAAQYLDYEARITRTDGRVFEGKIDNVSANKVWLKVNSPKGSVTLSLNIGEIDILEVYKVVEPTELNGS